MKFPTQATQGHNSFSAWVGTSAAIPGPGDVHPGPDEHEGPYNHDANVRWDRGA
jgi:hypothetical protein